ncbi:beta-agarase [Candidatus Epulonipiscium viviparus]|uniref:beta-agarase n=1 Tax=Candidatus Epulonipiscium viviparus TaxID=420336 RepID=UPI0027381350|nr:beta-agarase [Candidatus Epulopiscium viviparus]
MKLLKKAMIIASTLFFAFPISAAEIAANLPDYVVNENAAYETLDTVIEKYETKTLVQVNDHEVRIQNITVPIEPFTLAANETKEIEIPADLARIMFIFSRLDAYGSGFKNKYIEGISPHVGNTGKVADQWIGDTNYQVKTNSFAINHAKELSRGDQAYSGYKLKFTGPVVVDSLKLVEPNGASMTMDTRAWEVLGGDAPILDDIIVTVDATNRLSIEGITEFENRKFKTLYAYPIGHPHGYTVAEYFTPKDFMPGRQIFKFGPSLETGYDSSIPKLTEDASKPGYADYSIFPELFSNGASEIAVFDKLYPTDLEYVVCFDNWPSWTVEGINNGKGTPAEQHFAAAADLAAKYITAHDAELEGRGPTWIEVKNESDITSEWSHHATSDNGWELLAEFHNITADAIKAENPDALVGGPTSAWMALDNGNFSKAEQNLKFMDDTANHLDFYSYHFYESKNLVLNDTDSNYVGYLTGRLEADLDLLRNHMINTNNLKPIVISETGTLHNGPEESDYWIKLKNHNAYMVRYMNRANEFDIVVPFVIPATWWSPASDNILWTYDENGKFYPTPETGLTDMKYFIEMWDEYNGDLLPAYSNGVNNNIHVHSAQDGNIIYVAVTNMNAQRAYIDLDLKLQDEQIEKIERTTTYLNLGELHFVDNEPLDSLNDIFMHVEETSIFKITLNESPEINTTLTKTTYYGDVTLQPTGTPATFIINTPTDNVQSSILRISLGRHGGFNAPLNVSINDYNIESYDLSFTNKPDRYFGYVDYVIPTDILKTQNEITVTVPQNGGKISTVALIHLEN